MNILFLTISSFQHIDEQGIYPDLLRQFRDAGHNVYIVSPIERRHKQPTTLSTAHGVRHVQVKIGNITQNSLLEKGLSTVLIEHQYLRAIERYFPFIRFHLILYATPPITFERVIRVMKLKHDAKTYLLLKDIFPQNAVDLQMMKKDGYLHHYFRRKEQKLYALSDVIGCMSQANVDYIHHHHPTIPAHTIKICPNSIEPHFLESTDNDKYQIRTKYQIPLDKTVFIYGGNIGKPQGIPFMLQCLHFLERRQDAFFVIVGSGTELQTIESFLDVNKLTNVLLLQALPKEDYDELVASCDVGLIFLDVRFTIPNFPSRLLSYMEAGLPVLTATDEATDIGRIVEEAGFGLSCVSDNAAQFEQQVVALLDAKKRAQMGQRARQFLSEHYTAAQAYETIIHHLNER